MAGDALVLKGAGAVVDHEIVVVGAVSEVDEETKLGSGSDCRFDI